MEILSHHKSLDKCFHCIHPSWSTSRSCSCVFSQFRETKKNSIYYLATWEATCWRPNIASLSTDTTFLEAYAYDKAQSHDEC